MATYEETSSIIEKSIPMATPVFMADDQIDDYQTELTTQEFAMKNKVERIAKYSLQRLIEAKGLGIDVSFPQQTINLVRIAIKQKDYQTALRLAKQSALETTKIWKLSFQKKIELAKQEKEDLNKPEEPPQSSTVCNSHRYPTNGITGT